MNTHSTNQFIDDIFDNSVIPKLKEYIKIKAKSAIFDKNWEDNGYLKHNKFIILIETGEESGSPDLPYYIEEYKSQIGHVDLVLCLDSECGDYERLWITNSLRGTAIGNLEVKILKQGIHSGNSGIVASSFRILRNLPDRIEDSKTGKIKLKELNPEIPEKTMRMIKDIIYFTKIVFIQALAITSTSTDKAPAQSSSEAASVDVAPVV